MVEVGGDHARVVRAIPGLRGRLLDEGAPVVDRGGRRRAAVARGAREGLAAVTEEPLVHRPPPPASGPRAVERIEHAAFGHPVHEGEGGPLEPQARCPPAGRLFVHRAGESEPSDRVVTDGGDACRRDGSGVPVVVACPVAADVVILAHRCGKGLAAVPRTPGAGGARPCWTRRRFRRRAAPFASTERTASYGLRTGSTFVRASVRDRGCARPGGRTRSGGAEDRTGPATTRAEAGSVGLGARPVELQAASRPTP